MREGSGSGSEWSGATGGRGTRKRRSNWQELGAWVQTRARRPSGSIFVALARPVALRVPQVSLVLVPTRLNFAATTFGGVVVSLLSLAPLWIRGCCWMLVFSPCLARVEPTSSKLRTLQKPPQSRTRQLTYEYFCRNTLRLSDCLIVWHDKRPHPAPRFRPATRYQGDMREQ